jgi:hypothetical protein
MTLAVSAGLGVRPTKLAQVAQRWSAIYSRGNTKIPSASIAFNTVEDWSRDATIEIADELRRRYIEYDDVPASVLRFLETVNRH